MRHIIKSQKPIRLEPQSGDLVRTDCGMLAHTIEVKDVQGRRCLIAKPLRHPHVNIGGPIGRFRVIERDATKVVR